MAQRLQLGITQQLKMSPQLQQAVHLLQLSTEELNQEIQRLLESNVVLELEENAEDLSEAQSAKLNERTVSEKATTGTLEPEAPWEDRIAQKETLTDYLLWQLRLSNLSAQEYEMGDILVRSIGENGFLSVTIEEACRYLEREKKSADPKAVEAVLKKIQFFDPIGVGARNVKEFLLIQLTALPQTNPAVLLAEQLVFEHFDLVMRHDYTSLSRIHSISKDLLAEAFAVIHHLKPHPTDGFNSAPDVAQEVTPDVLVQKKNNTWKVRLNPGLLPKLRLNDYYMSLGQTHSESTHFIQQHAQAAQWFMKCLHTRNETLLRVAGHLVEQQKLFMEYGRAALQPLILQKVADALGLHPSTISRITTKKYIQTPQGTFELKSFFSSALKTSYGEACSSTAAQSHIQEIIRNENVHTPLSDESIAQLLKEKGILIARRTVTKYREMLHIPAAFERRQAY